MRGALIATVLVLATTGCCFGGSATGGGGGALPFLPPRETVLIDEVVQVSDSGFVTYRFTLPQPSQVRFEMDVTSGSGVSAYVMDEVWYAQFASAAGSLFGGDFRHYPALHASRTTQHRAYGSLAAGAYVVALAEGSEPNVFSGPDVALVRVRLVATR